MKKGIMGQHCIYLLGSYKW